MKSNNQKRPFASINRIILNTSVVALLAAGLACNDNAGTADRKDPVDSAKAVNKEVKPVQKDASDFAVKAADGGMLEVQMGKLAMEKGHSARVKQFGEMMVKDHTEANNKLKGITTNLNITIPDSVSNSSMKMMDDLKKKSGKDFDKAYVSMMVSDHKEDIADFRKCADNCSDSTLKTFAASTLPTLEKHLDSIQSINKMF